MLFHLSSLLILRRYSHNRTRRFLCMDKGSKHYSRRKQVSIDSKFNNNGSVCLHLAVLLSCCHAVLMFDCLFIPMSHFYVILMSCCPSILLSCCPVVCLSLYPAVMLSLFVLFVCCHVILLFGCHCILPAYVSC